MKKLYPLLKYKIKTLYREYQEFGLQYALSSIKNEVTYPFKRFYSFITKMFIYGKLLWYDFEFDYVYLLRILQLKLRLMADNFEKRGVTVSAPKKAKEIRICVYLIDRIIDNNYDELLTKKLEEKYGKLEWEFTDTEDSKFKELHLYRKKAPEGTPEFEDEKKQSLKIIKYSDEQRQRDINYLFDTMKKNIQGWWD